VLDPTAGSGANSFEALRLACTTYANEINPVVDLVEKATFEWPAKFGPSLVDEVKRLGDELAGRVIDGDQVKAQAQLGGMGEQLFAVVFKRRLPAEYTKTGMAKKDKWERGYRAPRPEDENTATIEAALAEKLPHWEALDLVPN
jgi:hypothetical protein